MPSLNSPPVVAVVCAPSTSVRGGFAVAGTLVRSQAASSTAQSLEMSSRWLALGPETSFVRAHLRSAAASFGTQSPARLQTANPSIKRTCLRQAAYAVRYVSGERGLSYQVSPQWSTFAAPSDVRGFRTATSCWLLCQARCVATRPLHQAGCPSRKLAASEPAVRLDARANSSPLPLASAYLREPLPHGTSVGPG